jgi:hypothetical protein
MCPCEHKSGWAAPQSASDNTRERAPRSITATPSQPHPALSPFPSQPLTYAAPLCAHWFRGQPPRRRCLHLLHCWPRGHFLHLLSRPRRLHPGGPNNGSSNSRAPCQCLRGYVLCTRQFSCIVILPHGGLFCTQTPLYAAIFDVLSRSTRMRTLTSPHTHTPKYTPLRPPTPSPPPPTHPHSSGIKPMHTYPAPPASLMLASIARWSSSSSPAPGRAGTTVAAGREAWRGGDVCLCGRGPSEYGCSQVAAGL